MPYRYITKIAIIIIGLSVSWSVQAQENTATNAIPNPTVSFYRAEIIEIQDESSDIEFSEYGVNQKKLIKTKITTSEQAGEEIEIAYYLPPNPTAEHYYNVGDKVIISKSEANGTVVYGLMDRYRLPSLIVIIIIFIVLAIILAGKKGLSGLAGLAVSIFLLVKWMVPEIADGGSAITVGLIGAIVIGIVSIYIAHGFNKPTSIAVSSTLLTTTIAMLMAWGFVSISQLFGTGSEEAYALQQFSTLGNIDLRGLLLVGIVIGSLGVLDDVTTSLTASIIELKKANMKLRFQQLFTSALRIGREHITSLINTLVLAYAGAAMPLLLFFTLDPRPLWVIINSQFIAEEIVRSLVGSIALMLAVPITAVLAAKSYERATPEELQDI